MSWRAEISAALDPARDIHIEDERHLDGEKHYREAAVLIPITDRAEPGVILTQRPDWLRSHAGQVAFPGGKIDPEDLDAIAAAFGVPITHRADAMALLQAHYVRAGLPFNEARQRMARIPDGAVLIDNPVSTAPGFTLGNVHVMAGVPKIFEAMVAGVLPRLTGGDPLLSQSLRVNRGEGEIAGPFAALAAAYPDLAMGSYPFTVNGVFGTNLVIRGTDPARLNAAMAALEGLFA